MSTIQIGGVNARFFFAGGYVWIRATDSEQWGLGGSIYLQHGKEIFYFAPFDIIYHSKTSATVEGMLPDNSSSVHILVESIPALKITVTEIAIPAGDIITAFSAAGLSVGNPTFRIIPIGNLIPLESTV